MLELTILPPDPLYGRGGGRWCGGRRGGPHHTGRGGPGGVSHISSYTLYLEISTFKY